MHGAKTIMEEEERRSVASSSTSMSMEVIEESESDASSITELLTTPTKDSKTKPHQKKKKNAVAPSIVLNGKSGVESLKLKESKTGTGTWKEAMAIQEFPTNAYGQIEFNSSSTMVSSVLFLNSFFGDFLFSKLP